MDSKCDLKVRAFGKSWVLLHYFVDQCRFCKHGDKRYILHQVTFISLKSTTALLTSISGGFLIFCQISQISPVTV